MERSRTLLASPRRPVKALDERPRRRGELEPHDELESHRESDHRGELLLGRYRLIERLGAGGFGVVWSAHDDQLDREVALKRIPLPGEDDRERATREALATARLAHPAIVALYEACSDDHAFYLISELVHGETLAELIAADELTDEQIFEVGFALTGALAHAHERGVIHRDVKPANVIVVDEAHQRADVAKLADFGGARLAGEDALTRTGDVLGTLAYMAPEQCEGGQVGAQADVYSLALVIYEALTGIQPVRGRTPAETARRIGEPIEPLERHRRDLPRAFSRTIDAALDPDPERRVTLKELREALENVVVTGDQRTRVDGERIRIRRTRPARPAPANGLTQPESSEQEPAQIATPQVTSQAAEPAQERGLWQRLAVPKALWLACVAGLAIWQAAAGRAGVSVLVLAAGLPLLALPRRSGPGWLAAALAPTLGLEGLAAAYPALAGQPRRLRARVGTALLGMWWLVLAEPLLGRRLWEGAAPGTPARAAWEGSPASAIIHVLGPLAKTGLAVDMAVWALAAALLPWIVRGRSAALDTAAAIGWTVALLSTAPLTRHALSVTGSQPRGALLGAVLGCVVAVCARAIRGPV